MRNKVIEAVEKEKIIVIVRGVESEKLIPLAEAMYEGGIRLLEITYSANGIVSDEETANNIKKLTEYFDGRMFIGAGTVVTEKQVELTYDAGGKFIISPDTYDAVIKKTRELNMVSIPGALTASEIRAAVRYGADYVKLFPVTNLGTDYVKAVKAPLSDIKMLAVGGIDENNMNEYLSVGISGFGVGTNIANKKMINDCDLQGLTNLANKFTKVIEKWQRA